MRIAFGNASYHPGDTRGRNAHIHQFITQAVAQGHEIWVWPARQAHPAVKVLPAGRLDRLAALRSMDAVYIRLQNDPVDIQRYGAFPYRQIIGSPVMVWEFNTLPVSLSANGNADSAARNLAQFKRYAPGCDLAVCVSDWLAGFVSTELNIRRCLVVPNGSDPQMFRPDVVSPVERVRRSERGINVVWIGSARLEWHNFSLLRDAARLLYERPLAHPVEFHLIGESPPDRDELPPNVRYHGPQPYPELPGWLAGMDIGLVLAYPGAYDYNSPLKLFDYMASGLTVAATEQPQVREIFTRLGHSDLIVPHDQPERLVEILVELAANPERVRLLGRANRQAVVEYYNWERAVSDTMTAIQQIRCEKKHGRLYGKAN